MKSKKFEFCTALLLMLGLHYIQAANYQEPVALISPYQENENATDPRQLHVSMSHFLGDPKYNSFWSWFTQWEKKVDTSKTNVRQFSAPVIKREACLQSKKATFSKEVETQWDSIIDVAIDFRWGVKSSNQRQGYGLWKQYSEDCRVGQYQDSKKRCQLCPIGCVKCNNPDQCITCKKNFTYVEGYNFGYCYPECRKGSYVQHLFTDDQSFLKKTNQPQRGKVASMTPTMMASQCEKCPTFCYDCIFDEVSSRAFCYQCQKGFTFSNQTGQCELTPCEEGQFRNRQLAIGQKLNESDNVDDYICKDCIRGCKNCINNQTCLECKPYFTMKTWSANLKTCFPCPAFCKNCTPGSNGQGVCLACDPKFFVINNGTQCMLNRTCAAGQWFNDVTLECQSCPSNCLTCKQGAKNGTTICTSCTQDMSLNNKTNTCVDKCNRFREFFSASNGTCIPCGNQTYPDQIQQKCTVCTKNCLDCGFRVNTNISRIGFEECLTCQNETYYDSARHVCRTTCNDTAIFNYTSIECSNCRADQYKNFTSELCTTCPQNCSSCVHDLVKKRPVCTGCKSSTFVVDYTTQTCRPNCTNSEHYFDFKNWFCRVCPSNRLINQTTKQCDLCPQQCSSCYRNETADRVECSKCDFSYVIDANAKLCRQNCPSYMTYYFETKSCRECPLYQSYSYQTKQCGNCSFGCIDCYSAFNNKKPQCKTCDSNTVYDYQKMQCKLPCNATTLFNYDSNTCESCPTGRYLHPNFKDCRLCTQSNCSTCNLTQGGSSSITQCTSCMTGYFLEPTFDNKGVCKRECQENSYYQISSKSCVTCPNGQYLHPQTKNCTSCPQNCTLCKTINGVLACTSCKTSFNLQQGVCRESCSQTAPYFDGNLGRCTSCPVGTYYSVSDDECMKCPTNCNSCRLNYGTNQVECDSCTNNWLFDEQYQLCKPNCASNQQYDWLLNKCTTCPAGTWLNTTNQICQKCPGDSCISCTYNQQSRALQCTNCYAGLEFDSSRKQCHVQCSSTQYWSWDKNTCVSCSSNQYLNTITKQCMQCPVNCASCSFNNNQVECNTCIGGAELDQNKMRCKLDCTPTTYYDWNQNTCVACPTGQFLYPDSESCQGCPTGCSSCNFNKDKQKIECQSCQSPLILDTSRQICRVRCNSTQYYDYDRQTCMSCSSTQYLDPSSGTCKMCPSNCQSCFINSTSQIECTSCSANFRYERQTCRQICNSTSQYDWSTQSCQKCKIGQWLSQSTQSCRSCDLGCYSCSTDILNPSASSCDQCLPTLVLDQGFCRKSCSSNQFYDWSITDCRTCTYPCLKCSDSLKCQGCDEMFNLNSNGQCVEKCIAGSELWNSATKRCESIRKLNLIVSAQTQRVWRCRNTTITAVGSGFTSSETPLYSWQYEILSGGISKDRWLSDMDSVINTANNNRMTQIIIPSTLSEKVSDNTTIRITSSMSIGSSIVSNTTNVIIEPFVFTQMTNYSTSYNIWVSDGLPIQMAFRYPECPVFKGPQAVSSTVNIGCSLYDSKSNLIKSLPQCQIQRNELQPGLTYLIKYYYAPNPLQTGSTNGLRDTITVNTIAQLPSCSIINANQIYVKTTETLQLSVSLINGRSGFVYQWNCNPLTTGASCGILQTTQNTADLSMPASSYTIGGAYNFTLSIFENNVFQTLCSARVEVVARTQTSLKLTYLDNANSRNYLDPSVTQNIICYQSDENRADLNYAWIITRSSDRRVIFNSATQVSGSSIQASGSSLSISQNSLGADTFDIACSATNIKYKGDILKTYTTSLLLPFNIRFDIFPTTGRAQDTVFSLSASKPAGQDLWCKFGYISGSQEIAIFDSQTPVFPSQSQTLVTKLDRVLNQDLQMLYVNCYDSSGAFARTQKNVTVTATPIVKLEKSLSNLNQMIRSKSNFLQSTSNSNMQRLFEITDIIQTSNKVQGVNQQIANLTRAELKNQTELMSQYVNQMMSQVESIAESLTTQEIDIVVGLIADIAKIAMSNPTLSTSNYKDILDALDSIASQKQSTLEKDQFVRILGVYSLFFNNSTYICSDYKKKAQQSIKTALLRVSGNILLDSSPYTYSNTFVSVLIQKISSEKFAKQESLPTNVYMPWKKDQISLVFPTNEQYSNQTNLIILESVFNANLFGSDADMLGSEIVSIELYKAKYPISFNGKVEAEQIDVQNLEKPIIISLPVNKVNKGVCSYFNEEKKLWTKLECSHGSQPELIDSKLECCTTHLTTFAVINPDLYSAQKDKEGHQLYVSLVPSLIILLLLFVPIIYRSLRKVNKNKEESHIPKQVNNTTQVEISSKSPNMDEISEFEISPAKMSTTQTERATRIENHVNYDNDASNSSSFLQNFKSAKLYILLSKDEQGQDLIYNLKAKFQSALVLFLCFTYSLPLIATNSQLVIIAVYLCTALSELLITVISRFSHMSRFTLYLWFGILSCVAFAQPFVISFGAEALPAYTFTQWIKCSVIVTFISAVLQDFLVVPLASKVWLKVKNSFVGLAESKI